MSSDLERIESLRRHNGNREATPRWAELRLFARITLTAVAITVTGDSSRESDDL
jgi:hypothetical protein